MTPSSDRAVTGLPWRVDTSPHSNYGVEVRADVKVKARSVICRIGGPDRDANAAFIVEACNAHHSLTERVRVLQDALQSLTNEVSGAWSAFELELRPVISNTNYAVMQRKLEVARAALASHATPERGGGV